MISVQVVHSRALDGIKWNLEAASLDEFLMKLSRMTMVMRRISPNIFDESF